MRSASRIAECSINTVSKLLVDVGKACAEYQDKHLRNLPCTRIECDEMWSYCYARRQNVPEGLDKYAGDLWTFTSICPDTKIVLIIPFTEQGYMVKLSHGERKH